MFLHELKLISRDVVKFVDLACTSVALLGKRLLPEKGCHCECYRIAIKLLTYRHWIFPDSRLRPFDNWRPRGQFETSDWGESHTHGRRYTWNSRPLTMSARHGSAAMFWPTSNEYRHHFLLCCSRDSRGTCESQNATKSQWNALEPNLGRSWCDFALNSRGFLLFCVVMRYRVTGIDKSKVHETPFFTIWYLKVHLNYGDVQIQIFLTGCLTSTCTQRTVKMCWSLLIETPPKSAALGSISLFCV